MPALPIDFDFRSDLNLVSRFIFPAVGTFHAFGVGFFLASAMPAARMADLGRFHPDGWLSDLVGHQRCGFAASRGLFSTIRQAVRAG